MDRRPRTALPAARVVAACDVPSVAPVDVPRRLLRHGHDAAADTPPVEVSDEDDTDPVTKERIQNMLEFVENTSDWYEKIESVPTPTLKKLMKLGTGITRALKK